MQADVCQPIRALGPESLLANQVHDLCIGRTNRGRKREHVEGGGSSSEIATSQLSDDERMNEDETLGQEIRELGVRLAKMRYPDGGIGKDDHALRRRGTSAIFGWVPPNAARRLPASLAMSASSPALTSAVSS